MAELGMGVCTWRGGGASLKSNLAASLGLRPQASRRPSPGRGRGPQGSHGPSRPQRFSRTGRAVGPASRDVPPGLPAGVVAELQV